jgi:hypothetical protein
MKFFSKTLGSKLREVLLIRVVFLLKQIVLEELKSTEVQLESKISLAYLYMIFSQTDNLQKLFNNEQFTIDSIYPLLDFENLSNSKQHQKIQPSDIPIGVNRVNELKTLAELDNIAAYLLGKVKVDRKSPSK